MCICVYVCVFDKRVSQSIVSCLSFGWSCRFELGFVRIRACVYVRTCACMRLCMWMRVNIVVCALQRGKVCFEDGCACVLVCKLCVCKRVCVTGRNESKRESQRKHARMRQRERKLKRKREEERENGVFGRMRESAQKSHRASLSVCERARERESKRERVRAGEKAREGERERVRARASERARERQRERGKERERKQERQ